MNPRLDFFVILLFFSEEGLAGGLSGGMQRNPELMQVNPELMIVKWIAMDCNGLA